MRHSNGFRPLAAALAALFVLQACDDPTAGRQSDLRDSAFVAALPVASDATIQSDHSLLLPDVGLRPGATADIHIRVFVNERLPCRDPLRTALFIHGVNATAASWESFARAFFTGAREDQLCLVAAVDHAGHGGSGLPRGMLFGELMIEDYARSVMEVLDRLSAEDIRLGILVGHSQGTSTIQTIQQMLAQEGTNLRQRFGVRDVVFLGAQGPREMRAGFLQPPEVVADVLAPLVATTPEKGTFFLGPPEVYQSAWFSNLSLELSSAAPSVETIAANGWNEDMPLFAVLQAAGQGGFDTPSVAPGLLGTGSGTRLHFIDFADDQWSLTPRAREIHEYLTGDASLAGFVTLSDPRNEAVHSYMVSHPEVVRNAIPLPRARSDRAPVR
jgi:pimeloyl-ACP methyl ester carboxylesterase